MTQLIILGSLFVVVLLGVVGVLVFGVVEFRRAVRTFKNELTALNAQFMVANMNLGELRRINLVSPLELIAQTLKEMRRGAEVSLADADNELERVRGNTAAAQDELKQILEAIQSDKRSHEDSLRRFEVERLANLEAIRSEAERERERVGKAIDEERIKGNAAIATRLKEIEALQQEATDLRQTIANLTATGKRIREELEITEITRVVG